MPFTLKELPYERDELYPYFSQETLLYHHDRHQAAYVNKLNQLLEPSPQKTVTDLTTLIQTSSGAIQAQAEQIWNHEFFWTCFAGVGKNGDPKQLDALIAPQFSNFDHFKTAIQTAALNHFASGWLWIWIDDNQQCIITTLSNSENPLRHGYMPILTIDLWEHAYYIDFRNDRNAYLEACFRCLNWTLLKKRWEQAQRLS